MLILEDNLKDLRIATDIALKAGFSDVVAYTSSSTAWVILGNGIEDNRPLPTAMILDLDLGLESGFELLRFCHKNRLVSRIPVVVWTVMDNEREICRLFGVHEFVAKHDGPDALYEALVRVNPPKPSQAAG
jgi:DNA-binding response OmpR family regulator